MPKEKSRYSSESSPIQVWKKSKSKGHFNFYFSRQKQEQLEKMAENSFWFGDHQKAHEDDRVQRYLDEEEEKYAKKLQEEEDKKMKNRESLRKHYLEHVTLTFFKFY